MAKYGVARLSGDSAPKFDDNETTMAELRQRIAKTLDYIKSVAADQIDGTEAREIEVPIRDASPLKFAGEAYLKHWVLPNFYFHVTIAYALLRHNGVEIGKFDFIGRD
jgi:hypothetical protein